MAAVNFTFQPLDGKKFNSLVSNESQDYFLKWGMRDRVTAQSFFFDQPFQSYQKDEFVLAFLQSPTVIHFLQVLSSSGKWVPLGIKAEKITAEPVPCSVLSMSFFDRLSENNIVRESGHIVKCFDEFCGDFTISDELRKMLLLEDSDNYDIYSESEREEFLFRLFKHLCLGGAVCQFEDEIKGYLDLTKLIYKDLVTVQKDAGSGDFLISSLVYKITANDDTGSVFYPGLEEQEQTFSYLIVDPIKRHATVFYHKFGNTVW